MNKDKTETGPTPSEKVFDVGYKKPPAHSRFKPGQSGNRKGRPKTVPTTQDIQNKLLNEVRIVRSGDKILKMTTHELMMRKQIELALKGDTRAFKELTTARSKRETHQERIPLGVKEMTTEDLKILLLRIRSARAKMLSNPMIQDLTKEP
ncbi:MAG: hypothetical protein HY242_10560 [Afipia sp.]|nr:hypothetical protein [Afipia sp.]